MRRQFSQTALPARIDRRGRAGVTLTEVLMSMMIMSIGVSAVVALFPIAALRSAQATKLTNGAILKYNIEAMIRARPELLFDPDGDFVYSTPGSPNYWRRMVEHFRANAEKRYVIDPYGYFSGAATYGTFGTLTRSVNAGAVDVDAVPAASRGYADYLGNTAAGATSATPYSVLPRYDGGLRAGAAPGLTLSATTLQDFELLGSNMANLGDGWDTVADEIAEGMILSDGSFVPSGTSTAGSVVGVRLDSELDLSVIVSSAAYASSLTIPDPELTRITVFSVDERYSQTYPLTAISASDCIWTEAAVGSIAAADYNGDGVTSLRAVPFEFGNQIGRVVIQKKRTQDFTWMLTVRRGSDGRATGVDVVVMFNDGRSPDNERVYPATFSAGSFAVVVNKTSGTDLNGDPAEPFIKRGGFVLDVNNARWYRIVKSEDNPADATGSTYLVTLETAALENSPPPPGGQVHGGAAIFLPGIVDVYPLGSVSLPETMTPPSF